MLVYSIDLKSIFFINIHTLQDVAASIPFSIINQQHITSAINTGVIEINLKATMYIMTIFFYSFFFCRTF